MTSPHLAVVFDFDETLVPDSTTLFLRSKGIDTEAFWNQEARALIDQGYEQPLHYLQLMLDMVGRGEPLEGVTDAEFRKFGATLDGHFFEGLPELFSDLRSRVAKYKDLTLDFYIVSAGIQPIIEGSLTVQEHFNGVYACRFGHHPADGTIHHIRRCVTFTEKTRYLFEINKGISAADSDQNPGLVNKEVPEAQRRVPFNNMIYIGDGLTDIPCFSLVRKNGGVTFGVFDPRKDTSAHRALKEFLQAGRVVSTHSPRYGPDDDLGSLVRASVLQRAASLSLDASQAF